MSFEVVTPPVPGRRAVIAGLAAAALLAPRAVSGASRIETRAMALRIERLAPGFERPVALAFPGRGLTLVAGKAGALHLLWPTGEVRRLGGVPQVFGRGDGGVLDIALIRPPGRGPELLLSWARPFAFTAARLAVARAGFDPVSERLHDMEIVFHPPEAFESRRAFGGRLVALPGGAFFLAAGDRGEAGLAEDPGRPEGKVLFLTPEGAPGPGVPVVAETATPGLWSLGHRDPMGLALSPQGGRLFLVERAEPGAGLYRVLPGLRHGPGPTAPLPDPRRAPPPPPARPPDPRVEPALPLDRALRPTALAFVPKGLFAPWEGDLLLGLGKPPALRRFRPDGDRVTEAETIALPGTGPVTDLRFGPDGALWLLAGTTEGAIFRVTPA